MGDIGIDVLFALIGAVIGVCGFLIGQWYQAKRQGVTEGKVKTDVKYTKEIVTAMQAQLNSYNERSVAILERVVTNETHLGFLDGRVDRHDARITVLEQR